MSHLMLHSFDTAGASYKERFEPVAARFQAP